MDGATSKAKSPISTLLDSFLPPVPPLINVSVALGNVSVTRTPPVCQPAGNQPSKGSSATNSPKDAGTNGSKDAGADTNSPKDAGTNGSKDAGADKGSSTINGSKDAGPDNSSSTTNGSNGNKK